MNTEQSASAVRMAFITGANRGIGAAVALALARRGIGSVLAVRVTESAHAVARAVKELGTPCFIEPCDVAQPDSVKTAVGNALQSAGRLDILINNAGQIEPIAHIGDTAPDAWLRALAVNLGGAYSAMHACLPALIEKRGVVINLSSGAAHVPREGWSAYCSSKAALVMLTRCLVHEYANRGIAAYGFQPGVVDTEMQQSIRISSMNEISRIPRDSLASPEKAARVIAWLADTRPQDLSGKDLSINDAIFAPHR